MTSTHGKPPSVALVCTSVAKEITSTTAARPRLVAICEPGRVMAGVARLDSEDAHRGLWEAHEAGDELLVIIAGRAVLVTRATETSEVERREVVASDLVIIPRGLAHSFERIKELALVFVTPSEGNRGWSATGNPVASRHP